MIILSVVSGTFNRLSSLQRMVQSARQSLGPYAKSYEFVLVDGGSTDGTIEWCSGQPDIRLIQHRSLLGAVRAFNDGANASQGHYVILANDDISFVEDSIARTIIHMQENPDCGIGCFYQDRHNKGWHVENMPVIVNNQQSSLPYGQVCIVPRFLGNTVGWWGKYLHTYGGDNEISCNIYEMGYKITPVSGAKIHDHHVNDNLRKINNDDKTADPMVKHHPDSLNWGRKWSKDGKLGPNVKFIPMIDNPIPRIERILYMPIYEQGWEHLQYKQKRGLREALQKNHLVWEYDYVHRFKELGHEHMISNILSLCSIIQPTIVLTQLHNATEFDADDIVHLKSHLGNALFVNWNGDFWPNNLLPHENLELNRQFDIVGLVNRDVVERYGNDEINAFYWQIGWEPDGIIGQPDTSNDIVFLANGYSKERKNLVRNIKAMGFSFALYGHWPDGWASGENTYNFQQGCKIYRGAKLAVGDSQWPESGFVSNRLFQILCTGGCALFHQYFKDYEKLGLRDGVNCIIWHDLNEFEKKAKYYLSHDSERKQIARSGMELALSRHSFGSRVQQLFQVINSIRTPKTTLIPDWK